jgi:hypothetical protein
MTLLSSLGDASNARPAAVGPMTSGRIGGSTRGVWAEARGTDWPSLRLDHNALTSDEQTGRFAFCGHACIRPLRAHLPFNVLVLSPASVQGICVARSAMTGFLFCALADEIGASPRNKN